MVISALSGLGLRRIVDQPTVAHLHDEVGLLGDGVVMGSDEDRALLVSQALEELDDDGTSLRVFNAAGGAKRASGERRPNQGLPPRPARRLAKVRAR
jgi:hypothetical protein